MKLLTNPKPFKELIPKVLQVILNIGLSVLALALCVMLIVEMVEFLKFIINSGKQEYK